MAGEILQQLDRLIDQEMPRIVPLRHELHAHPQVAFEETYASQLVQRELKAAGVAFVGGLAGTGVVAWLGSGQGGKTAIALRADMDALPIQEASGLSYASVNAGCMHACGHDGHTAILLGAARILARLQEHLPRPVKFIFQPAEEIGGGAQKMVEAGALDERTGGMKVSHAFGFHGWPTLPVGTIGTRSGAFMASMDPFTITIHGRGGHGALPHTTDDPIMAGAHIVTAIQTIVSRNLEPGTAAVITVGAFQAGTTNNVIPAQAILRGTIRAMDDGARSLLHRRLGEVATSVAAGLRCTAELHIHEGGYPPTINDPAATTTFLNLVRDATPDIRVVLIDHPLTVAEDFAYYGRQVPSCFAYLGLCPVDRKSCAPLHTPEFDFNDDTMRYGIRLFCRLALMTTGV